MVEMQEGHKLKHIHDTLATVIDRMKELTTTINDIKEQLHLVDGSQTRIDEHARYE